MASSLSISELSLWRSRLSQAIALQEMEKPRWESSLDFIRLQWFERRSNLKNDPDRVDVNWAWSYLNSLIPTLYAKDPKISCKPTRPRSTPFAQTMEEVLEYEKREKHLKDGTQRVISDTVPAGIGWMEVNYLERAGERERASNKPPTLMQTVAQALGKSMSEILPPPVLETPVPGQLLPEVREGELYLRWLPFWRILLAPGYHLVREMPYLIQIDDVEMEDLAANPRYPEDKIRRLRPTKQINVQAGQMRSPNPPMGATGSRPIPVVRLYHIYNRRDQQIVTFADGFDEELRVIDWPLAFDEFPFVPLIFNDTPPDEQDPRAYPMDDITPLKPQLMEKTLLRTSMVKIRRQAMPSVVVDSNIHDDNDIRKMQGDGNGVNIIGIPGGSNGVLALPPIRIPDDCFKMDAIVDQDLTIVSGYSQLLLAGQQAGDPTATEVNYAASATNLRTSRKLDIVEEFIIEVARRMAAICWEKYDRVHVADILGKEVSEDMWPDLSQLPRAEVQRKVRSELDFKIEAGSTQSDQTRLIEQNLWIRAINMLKAAFPGRFYDDRLLEQFLKKLGFKEIEYLIKMQDSEEMMVAQQENQLLLQNVPQLVGPNELHEIHLQAHAMAAQMGSTPALDQHILSHNQYRMAQDPKSSPQKGDVSSPAQAAVPELQRAGVEKFPDMAGDAMNLGGGLGPESSMAP